MEKIESSIFYSLIKSRATSIAIIVTKILIKINKLIILNNGLILLIVLIEFLSLEAQ